MFSLSNLTKYIWGNSEGSELAVIPSGQFYVLRKASKRAPRQCIYNEAQLAIRRTDVKYQYQLEVARVYYDEAQRPDDSKLTDDDELDDEQMFLIDKTLQFRESEYDDKPSFVWCDPANKSEGIDEEYEFVIDSELRSAKLSPGQFLVVFGQCVWERTHRKSNKLATNEEIEGIINEMAADASRSHGGDRDNSGVDTLAKQVGGLTVAEDTSTPTLEAPDPPATLANGTEIAKSSGMFFIYDPELQGFVLYDDEVEVSVVATGRFQYHLNVVGYHGNKTEDARAYNVLSQLIEPNMNATFNHEYLSLIWNYFEPEGRKRAFSLSVKYEDGDMFSQMHLALTKAAFETVNCEKWEEVNEAERIYMLRASDDKMDIVEPGEEILERFKGASSDEEDEPEMGDDDLYYEKHPEREYVRQEWPEADEGSEKSGEDDDEDEEDEGDDGDAPDGKGREWKSNYKNSQLAVGYQHDRSFVLRGNQIGVFKHTDDDRLEFDTTINRIDDTNGNEFLPNHMMLHEQDRTMVLMNPDEPNNLYKMDLEYGKVVEEWKVHDIIPTRAIAADTKYAPTTATKTLTGISDQAIYRIDPRVSGQKLVDSQFKLYAGKKLFTSVATTEQGHLAVGNTTGGVQLFDRIGIRAKTMLPGLGDAIIGIDVTADGRYILATCKTYLLLIDTKLPDDPKDRTGFQKSFPASQKPLPKRLFLRGEHLAYMCSNGGSEIKFTPARFNTAPADDADTRCGERIIVTSTGPYVITWNLRQVLQTGKGDKYNIKVYPEKVVADNFRFGQDRSIIVTLPNDVTMIRRDQMVKATRKSFMTQTPTRKLKSRSEFVNSPY